MCIGLVIWNEKYFNGAKMCQLPKKVTNLSVETRERKQEKCEKLNVKNGESKREN